jgi:hypothetical protein
MAMGVSRSAFGSLMAVVLLTSACASMDGDPTLQAWRKVNQADKRFAVFISEPGVREGALATFRMRFIYMPGEVKHEGKDVAWQEYHAMTVDCAKNTVRVGPRTRYAPDGVTIVSDDDQTFGEIIWGAREVQGRCLGRQRHISGRSGLDGRGASAHRRDDPAETALVSPRSRPPSRCRRARGSGSGGRPGRRRSA